MLETDCAVAVNLIKESTPNTSTYAFRISSIRDLIKERETKLASISCDGNGASHELARLGRVQARTEVWPGSFPLELAMAIATDCNPTSA